MLRGLRGWLSGGGCLTLACLVTSSSCILFSSSTVKLLPNESFEPRLWRACRRACMSLGEPRPVRNVRPSGVTIWGIGGGGGCWLGSATFSGKGPRHTTRVGSIGVRWHVGVGGSRIDPIGDAGDTLLESERVSAEGAKVSGECGELGETGEQLLPLL